MRAFLTIFTLLIIATKIRAQDGPQLPTKDWIQSQQLDSLFADKNLIGVGESTHGTSEFTRSRLNLFQFLVEHHGFNSFFLEADAVACMHANRYVHGDSVSIDKALKNLCLWPWMTEEMEALMNWMKMYNENHETKLNFIGCDAQMILDANRLIEEEFIKHKGFEKLHQLMDVPRNELINDKGRLQEFISSWDSLKSNFASDNPSWPILKKDIDQWIVYSQMHDFRKKRNFRDSIMAVNMVDYLENHPESKGMYFAHNVHVSRREIRYAASGFHRKWCGAYLQYLIKSKYVAIAQDFYEGSFNAIFLEGEQSKMGKHQLKAKNKKHIAYAMIESELDIDFILVKDIPKIYKKEIHYAGAIFGKTSTGGQYPSRQRINENEYDAIILFKSTTPSHLK